MNKSPEELAKEHIPVGMGRERIEHSFLAGYTARLHKEQLQVQSNSMRYVFNVLTISCLVAFLCMCFGELPIEKAIDNLNTKYKDMQTKAICDNLSVKKNQSEDETEQNFSEGCLWNIKEYKLIEYKNEPDQQYEIENIFMNEDSTEFKHFKALCDQGASQMMLRGKLNSDVVMDLWKTMECQKLYE